MLIRFFIGKHRCPSGLLPLKTRPQRYNLFDKFITFVQFRRDVMFDFEIIFEF